MLVETMHGKVLLAGLAVIAAFLAGWMVDLHGAEVLIWMAGGAGFALVVIRPRVGLYALLLLIPLEDALILAGGTTMVKILGLTVGAAWGMSKVVRKEPIQPLLTGPLAMPIFIFLSVAAASISWSDVARWRLHIMSYLQLAVMAFIVLDLVDSPRRLKQTLLFLFLGAMISAATVNFDVVNFASDVALSYRTTGGRGDPNFSSLTFLIVMPVAFWLVQQEKGYQRLIGGIGAAFLMAAVGLTVSRTGLIAIVLLLVVQFAKLRKRRWTFILVVVIALLAASQFMPWERIMRRFLEEELPGGRLHIAEVGLSILRQYPLTGVGLGRQGRRTVYVAMHNAILEMGAQLGVPGLLSMGWLCAAAWRCISRASRKASVSCNGQVSALISVIWLVTLVELFFSLTLSTNQTQILWLVFALTEVCYRMVNAPSPKCQGQLPQRQAKGSPEMSAAADRSQTAVP